MEKTLENYSIRTRVFTTNDYKHELYDKLLDSNEYELLISIFNSQAIMRNISNSLFKTNLDLGKRAIKLFEMLLTTQEKYIVVEYTNCFRIVQDEHGNETFVGTRVTQDIWAFSSKKEAQKWMKEMQDIANEIPQTHLYAFSTIDNSDEYMIDQYYSDDQLHYLKTFLTPEVIKAWQETKYQMRFNALKVETFDKLMIKKAFERVDDKIHSNQQVNLGNELAIYNVKAKAFRQKVRKADLLNDKLYYQLLKEKRIIDANYNNHKPDPSQLTGVIERRN